MVISGEHATVDFGAEPSAYKRSRLYRAISGLVPGQVLSVGHRGCERPRGRGQCPLHHSIWQARDTWGYLCHVMHVGDDLWIVRLPGGTT